MGGVTTTNAALASYKEIWIDQLRYKKIKSKKMMERGKRIKDNTMFEKDQRNFYNKIEKNEKFQGEQPEMEKASINTVKEFTIEEERLIKIAKKQKN